MIALQHASFGEPLAVIVATDISRPEPGPGEIRIRMRRSPIHNHDLATIRGVYGYKPTLPATGGSELVGIVDAVGSGVAGIEIGTRIATTTHGAWAEYVIVPATAITPVPDAIDDDRACQLLAMPLSAFVLVDELRVQPGEWIVQNAAGGAVASIVRSIARTCEINVIDLVRSEDAANRLLEQGVPNVVVTRTEGWEQRVRRLAGGAPIARAIDSVGGAASLELQRLLGRNGQLIVFGALSGEAMKLDPGLMISNELSVRGFWMTAWMRRADRAMIASSMRRVFEAALSGNLPLRVAETYSLTDATAAIRAAEAPGRNGKILLRTP